MSLGQIDQIVYFGDSQTDGGNLLELTSRLFTQPFPLTEFGYSENVTNGENYADVATRLLGVEEVNFSFGGARALGNSPLSEAIDPALIEAFLVDDPDPADLAFDSSFSGQVARYIAGVDPAARDAVSIYIGLNDFNNFVPTDPTNVLGEATALAELIILQTLGSAQAMVAAGADAVILNTLAPASFFPAFQFADPILQAAGDPAIAAFNDALVANAAGLTAAGVDVRIVDIEAISAEILADPSAFGFQTVTDQLLFGTAADPIITETPDGLDLDFPVNPVVAGLEPDQFAFYDLLHPTEATHQVYGIFTAETLENGAVIGGGARDDVSGTGADDFVLSRGGRDRLDLGGGDDTAMTGRGHDQAMGGFGSDLISLGAGRDFASGGAGADLLAGGDGRDVLLGRAGADLMIGGLGADRMFGGFGRDLFVFDDPAFLGAEADGRTRIFGGQGFDTVVLRLGDDLRAEVEAELAGQSGDLIEIEALNLVARDVEAFEFRGRTEDLTDLTFSDDLKTRIEEAELWGVL